MKLRIATKWLSEAKYNVVERKHSHSHAASTYIKKQATREQRRNSKYLTKYELSTNI